MSKSDASRVLRSLPREKAFYFFTSIGNYTGKSAASLKEFVKAILDVNVKSLEFHLYRGDFEKWIAEALEDNLLASKIRQLKAYKPIGMDLRDRLYLIVSKRYENLERPQTSSTVTSFTKPKTTTFTFPESQSSGTLQSQNKD
ncbi:MAG: DUF5752 family protein [Candidatus Bathyarchaeota archaeon]|nr:DUF5752 family protein [Candidatus Bathyarchaeota archaeon]